VAYLDGVDIGMPNDYYDLSSAQAHIVVNGEARQPSQIHTSPYVSPGIAVEFDQITIGDIQSYGTFELFFSVNNPHMIYNNTLVPETAGVRFRPTWFSTQFQIGNTGMLEENFIFPAGFDNASQAVYLQGFPWHSMGLANGTGMLVATWRYASISSESIASGAVDFGAGFPQSYVDVFFEPGSDQPPVDIIGDVCTLANLLIPFLFVAFIVTAVILSVRKARTNAKDYFEPKLDVIGAGPRRDLTAVGDGPGTAVGVVATPVLFGLPRRPGRGRIRESHALVKKAGGQVCLRTIARRVIRGWWTGRARPCSSPHRVRQEQDVELQKRKGYYGGSAKAWQEVKAAGTPRTSPNPWPKERLDDARSQIRGPDVEDVIILPHPRTTTGTTIGGRGTPDAVR
jgi:hypothetical protein